jgi:apolipoprotein N-acyltransferase
VLSLSKHGSPNKTRLVQKIYAFIKSHPRWILLIAGGLSATGFAPLSLWPITIFCLALLMHLVAKAESGKLAFLLGWLFGIGHFTIGNNWIATAFTYQSNMPAWLGWLAVPLLALYLAVYPGLAAWGGWWIAKRVTPAQTGAVAGLIQHPQNQTPAAPASAGTTVTLPYILAFAGCWIITEWLRAWVFTGFAWNPLSAIVAGSSYAYPATLIGTYGLSGLILLYIGLPIRDRETAPTGSGEEQPTAQGIATGTILVLFVSIGFIVVAGAVMALLWPVSERDYRTNTDKLLTIVQPNMSQIDKYAPGYDAMNFARHARHSQPLDETPRLLLWTEAAIPWRLEEGYPYRYYQFQPGESAQGARLALMRLMNPGDVLITGLDRLEFDKDKQLVGARNSATAMDSSGKILANYNKAHLVPFGEYLALRWLLEPLGASRLVPGSIDFWPGPGPRTLDLPFDGKRVKVGMQICYEIIFSGEVTDRANRPDFLFNPSNDAWFGSWGPPQSLAQARLRAIEEGLPVVRATPTGISAVIDADGQIMESLPTGKAGRIDARLPVAKAPTLFALYGNVLPLGFAALLIAFALLPLARARFSR